MSTQKKPDPRAVFSFTDFRREHEWRNGRMLYVDGPNGMGVQGSHITVHGPDKDAITAIVLAALAALPGSEEFVEGSGVHVRLPRGKSVAPMA